MTSHFGPFETAFKAEGLAVPGYLTLLNLSEGADIVVERISKALDATNSPQFVQRLLADVNWRMHLVGAIAYLLDRGGRFDRTLLWHAIDAGSWVTPQLVVTALFSDKDFAARARKRIEQRCPIYARTLHEFGFLSGLLRHVFTGPAGTVERSGKMLASILGVCAMSPALTASEAAWRTDPALAGLLQKDSAFDQSDHIASDWISSAQQLFLRRGIALSPAA